MSLMAHLKAYFIQFQGNWSWSPISPLIFGVNGEYMRKIRNFECISSICEKPCMLSTKLQWTIIRRSGTLSPKLLTWPPWFNPFPQNFSICKLTVPSKYLRSGKSGTLFNTLPLQSTLNMKLFSVLYSRVIWLFTDIVVMLLTNWRFCHQTKVLMLNEFSINSHKETPSHNPISRKCTS